MYYGHVTVVEAFAELLFAFDSCVAVVTLAVVVITRCVQLPVAAGVVKCRMTEGVAPTRTLPRVQVTCNADVSEQEPAPPADAKTRSAGKVYVTTTLAAVIGPVLETVIL